jgi:SNF2 family DNA or RNA helicase
MLNSLSPRIDIDSVKDAKVLLKPHQLAIVQRCADIENHVYSNPNLKDEAFGILGAPVGCGKTFCMLSLCLLDKLQSKRSLFYKMFSVGKKVTGATMIVVPSHIFKQWDDAITEFLGDELIVHRLDSYGTVSKLYTEEVSLLQKSDIFLVSSLFYHSVASTLLTVNVTFRRLVFDEADNISNMINNACPATMTWFVSASIKSIAGPNGLQIGSDKGGFKVPAVVLNKLVDCDVKFIAESFQLPDIINKQIVCRDVMIDGLLPSILSTCCRAALFACDAHTVQVAETGSNVEAMNKNDVTLARALLRGWVNKIADLGRIEDPSESEKALAVKLKANVAVLERALIGVADIDKGFSKIDELMDICKTNTKKMIIFTQFPRVLYQIQNLLTESNIKFSDFEGGTAEKMAAAQDTYTKSSDTNIMMAPCTQFSCGTNLQNTDHIVFLHRVPAALRDQVIGRGQRPGRNGQLTVTELVYAGEKN